jgi:hypothetical protein
MGVADKLAKAIREEIVRQYRDDDRGKCPAGISFWEEEIQPFLLAHAALAVIERENMK